MELGTAEARKIILQASGLNRDHGSGPEAVLGMIEHLGFVQIDTNTVVERAHHHQLFSRVPDYRPEWLWELQEDGLIQEYLMSDAGFMPITDFPYTLPVKQSFRDRQGPLTREMKQVLDRVEREGPLTVSDFEQDRPARSTGWWDWRPAKVALEHLYQQGYLSVSRTKDFRKQYEALLENDEIAPSAEAYARFIIRRTIGALGLAYPKEIAWRARFCKGNLVKSELAKMVAEGEITIVHVEGSVLYGLPDLSAPAVPMAAHILSPFDQLNVFRHRLKEFFDFDYQIECFVPAPKRKYGYFSLPILIGDRFVARMDAKADRKNKVLLIHNLHFEEVVLEAVDLALFSAELKRLTLFNSCDNYLVSKTNRSDVLGMI